jgi:hypothetical protein
MLNKLRSLDFLSLLFTPSLLRHSLPPRYVPKALSQQDVLVPRVLLDQVVLFDPSPARLDRSEGPHGQEKSRVVLPIYLSFLTDAEDLVFEKRPFGYVLVVAGIFDECWVDDLLPSDFKLIGGGF